jgi:F0F1-type ATP synthase delta subunit
MIDRSRLAEVIAERTMHAGNVEHLKREIAAFLLAEKLSASVESIMRDVMAYRAEHGLVEATVVSAYPLTALTRKDVLRELKDEYPHAGSIVLNEKLDPSLVGGVKIESVNEQLDMTVRAKLNKLKRLTAARDN